MRQLVLQSFPDDKGLAVIENREYRYLAQVLRLVPGDVVEARFPDGSLSTMLVASVDRKARNLVLQRIPGGVSASDGNTSGLHASGVHEPDGRGNSPGVTLFPQELPGIPGASMPALAAVPSGFPRIILFQWILKGPKMDQVIRQATETGVELIVPVAGERCLSRDADGIGDGKTDRWDRIVREARQQSGSPVSTRIIAPVPVSRVAAVLSDAAGQSPATALVLTEAPLARKSMHEYLVTGTGLVALAVGPEGGMSARELETLAAAGFACIHFRTNILRAETAALYGIAAVQSALTESEKWQLKE